MGLFGLEPKSCKLRVCCNSHYTTIPYNPLQPNKKTRPVFAWAGFLIYSVFRLRHIPEPNVFGQESNVSSLPLFAMRTFVVIVFAHCGLWDSCPLCHLQILVIELNIFTFLKTCLLKHSISSCKI